VDLEIKIKGKNIDVSDDLTLYTERKLGKLTKYLKRLQSATATFTERASKNLAKSHRVEVVLRAPGQTLRSEEESESFYIAIDATVDKLRRQLRKLKTKRVDKSRERPVKSKRPAKKQKPAGQPAVVATLTVGEPVVLVERFPVKPMTMREAIMQLDLEGRSFMPFVNEQSVVNCVYRRADGEYGLLIPEGELK
jgi:putative sigma-54 modulation protein